MESQNLKQELIFRAPTLDDVQMVVDLMNASTTAAIGEADETVDGMLGEWQAPGRTLSEDELLVLTPEGELVGYVRVMDHVRPMTPFVDAYVRPGAWNEGLADELLKWGEERASKAFTNPRVPADARVVMQAFTYASETGYKAAMERAGMHIARVHWRMQIDFDGPPPAPEWPEGITVRNPTEGEDLTPILHAIRDAWQDHWGYVEIPFDEHYTRWVHDWQGDGHFDPSLWFIAMDGDRVAGFSLCRSSHAGDEEFGWVATLGVRREYRKNGLGMALLLHSFTELYKRGKKRVGLGVDAGSLTGATRLYQRAGMHIATQMEAYEKELRPGVEYRTGV